MVSICNDDGENIRVCWWSYCWFYGVCLDWNKVFLRISEEFYC